MYFRRIALPQGSHENDSGFTEYALMGASEKPKFLLIMAWRITDYFKINFKFETRHIYPISYLN